MSDEISYQDEAAALPSVTKNAGGMVEMRKLNVVALSGFAMCFLAILFGIATNGGIATIWNFIHGPSLIVTLGGALFATVTTADSFGDFIDGCRGFGYAFHSPGKDPREVSEQMLALADVARKEGLLALEGNEETMEDEFMSKGVRLIVDGTDPELVKDILETEFLHKEERNRKRVRFWQDLGSAAPAWGMVGTLLGLINMMKSMGTDSSAIGAGMSLALITTLYGSVIANWVCIPVARKIEKNGDQESLVMEVTLEGLLSIQAGENPGVIKEKLKAVFSDGSGEREEEQ